LALIDVAGGAQPLVSHDRRFVISFNGEIYNYPALREILLQGGSRFVTRSDTEVLVEAWRAWGEESLLRLRGMFAFALYDTQSERLVLARDPFGKKPLFLTDVAGGTAFASEIAPLLALPGVGGTLNRAVIAPYLMKRYAPSPESFFQGVRKLPPGCFAVGEAGVLSERRYFTPPLSARAAQAVPFAEAVEAFGGGLQTAVRLRLRSEAPYGVYLSGGLDSSTIAALAARQVGRLSTFAVGFEEAAYSELGQAAWVAANLGADHQALTVTAGDFARHWPDAVRHRGAPVSEASDIPLLMLSMAARASVKMVLTGEGADELLAGYPKHRVERWAEGYHALIPARAHRRLLAPLIRRLPYGSRRFKVLGRALSAANPAARAQLWFANADPDGIAALTGAAAPLAPSAPMVLSPLRQAMLADQTGWLPDNLLERSDRMLMAAGIEGRMPFMDAELAALVAGFPDELLFDRRGGKAILRAVAKNLLDPQTLHRRKVGFRTPVGDWFRGPLRPMLLDLLRSEASGVRRLLNEREIDRLLGEHLARRVDHTDMLWTLANLELFLQQFGLGIDAGPVSQAWVQAA
jgi:asparagine synthase (glutamine-hydrolysing)